MSKASERRSSLRRPIHHEALMQTGDGFGLSCIITDFCLDGMFIKFIGTNLARAAQFPHLQEKNTAIALSFTGDKGQSLNVQAEIVHSMEGACGLRFLKRYDQAVQSLINVSVRAGVVPEHSVPVQNIIDQCIQCIHQEYGALLNHCWPALSDMLKSEAVKASNDQAANMLMALSEKTTKQKNALQQAVMQAIQDPVAAFNTHLEKRQAMSDKLAIIDKDEFEDWLLARVLIMKCEANYQFLLLPLKLRLDALGVGDKRHHQSVFGPALLVNAFQSAIQSLMPDRATEKRIFRLFEELVMSRLESLYQALNDTLIRHNILPKLDVKQAYTVKNVQTIQHSHPPRSKPDVKQPHDQLATHAAQDATAHKGSTQKATSEKTVIPDAASGIPADAAISESANSAAESSRLFTLPPFSIDPEQASSFEGSVTGAQGFNRNNRQAQSAITNISHLFKRLRTDQEESDPSGAPKVAYTATELEQGLATLQADNSQSDLANGTLSLMERVRERLQQSGDKQIEVRHKTAIDVVDRFFLSMRNNPRISDEAKQFLLKLDVPILKVLLKDDSFFVNRQSSVRGVINRIAQLGAKDAKLHPSSKAKIESLVNQLIAEFDSDTSVFDKTLDELNKLLERQNHIYIKNVERVAAAAEGALKVEEANLAVMQAVNKRIASKFVPSAVITLLNEGWREYLHLTHIKHGEESLAWQEGLSVLDRLIAYGDDPRIPIDIKVVLPKIQEGLKLVSANNEASIQVRDALKAFILNAPKGLHLSEQAQLLSLPETEEDLLKRNITKSQALKDWILKVKAMPLGSWFKFIRQDQQTNYIRLVWVAKGFSKFVFVNHQGMRVIELGLFKLADYFKEGLITPEHDYELPIVNQGLDDMVKDVYDRLAYESSHDSTTGLIKKAEFCRQVRILMKKGKRTLACSLIMIRFRSDEQESLTLTDDFAKKVVQALEMLPAQYSILGRLAEADFVIFSVIDDANTFRTACQESLISLCNAPEQAAQRMMVTLGESRAHLGFNNPESMIRHACEVIESSLGHVQDEAANAEPDEQEFSHLDYQLYTQATASITQSGESGDVSSRNARLEHNVQLNLLYFIKDQAQAYYPENEASANALDEWWLNTLEAIKSREPQLFASYDCVRVSLSAYALNSQTRVDQLLDLAKTGRLEAAKLCFDVYDCFQIEDVDLVAIRMNLLKQAGYRFCLEHFGTERCPFAYLKALPADMIKIDDSFVAALNDEQNKVEGKGESQTEQSEVGEASADSIVEIAHYMGKKVLASFVDSAVCLQKMKHLNVDFVQGSTVAKLQIFDL